MRSRLKNLSIDEAKQKLKIQKNTIKSFLRTSKLSPLRDEIIPYKFESLLENKKEKITFC